MSEAGGERLAVSEPVRYFALRGVGLGTEVGFGRGGVGKGAAVTCSSHCGDISFHRGYFARAPRCVWETIGLCGVSGSYTGCGECGGVFLRRNMDEKRTYVRGPMMICSTAPEHMILAR